MTNFADKLYLKMLGAKNKAMKHLKNERGEANIIAIILVLAIVIALAIIFKDQLTALFNKIWNSLFADVDNVL